MSYGNLILNSEHQTHATVVGQHIYSTLTDNNLQYTSAGLGAFVLFILVVVVVFILVVVVVFTLVVVVVFIKVVVAVFIIVVVVLF